MPIADKLRPRARRWREDYLSSGLHRGYLEFYNPDRHIIGGEVFLSRGVTTWLYREGADTFAKLNGPLWFWDLK